MAGLKDYYEFLGVNPNATQEEIKKAWRRFSNKNHPDKHASKGEAEEKKYQSIFQEGQDMYNTLKDETKRAEYHRRWNANFNFGTGKNNEYSTYTNTRSNNTGKKSDQTYNHYSNQNKKQQTRNGASTADDKAREEARKQKEASEQARKQKEADEKAKREKAEKRREYWNKKGEDFKKDFKTYSSKAGKQAAKEWSYFWEATKQGGKKTKEGFSSVKDDISDLYSKFKNYKQRKKTEKQSTGNRNNYGNTSNTNYNNGIRDDTMNNTTTQEPEVDMYEFARKFGSRYKGDPSGMAFNSKLNAGINKAYEAKKARKSREQKIKLEEQEARINPPPTEEELIQRERNAKKKRSLEKDINLTGAIVIPAAAIAGLYLGYETNGEIFQHIGDMVQTGFTYIANNTPDTIAEYFTKLSKVTTPEYINKAADIAIGGATLAVAAYGFMKMEAKSVAKKYMHLNIKTDFNK